MYVKQLSALPSTRTAPINVSAAPEREHPSAKSVRRAIAVFNLGETPQTFSIQARMLSRAFDQSIYLSSLFDQQTTRVSRLLTSISSQVLCTLKCIVNFTTDPLLTFKLACVHVVLASGAQASWLSEGENDWKNAQLRDLWAGAPARPERVQSSGTFQVELEPHGSVLYSAVLS